MSKKKILYIGRFEMPDKDAAANRVYSNAKIFRDLGFEVELFGWSNELSAFEKQNAVKTVRGGFVCYEKKAYTSTKDRLISIFNASDELNIIKNDKDIYAVIAYNFPSVAMRKIFSFCKKRNILCIADATEWFGRGRKNPLTQLVRVLDSFYRMRVVHKKADGLIVVSRFLENYYKKKKTLLLPPLTDPSDEKWLVPRAKKPHDGITLLYAGSPSATKERLDKCVNAVLNISDEYSVNLKIIGISREKFEKMYNYSVADEAKFRQRIEFFGKVPHKKVLEQMSVSDYALIIREKNRVTTAGFPSKFAESITAALPVISTDNSDLSEYIEKYNCGFIIDIDNIEKGIEDIVENKETPVFPCDIFDYRRCKEKMTLFLAEAERAKNK